MSKLRTVRSGEALDRNTRGRDLVVGDLHGHRALFEQELERLDFDPEVDRVLSVGDLVDRGPDCLGTLALIEEPWFHAVLGNHELMLLHYLGYFSSRVRSRSAYAQGGGGWVIEAAARHRRRLALLADRLAELSLTLSVDAEVPFRIAHTDLETLGTEARRFERRKPVSTELAEALTESRAHHARLPHGEFLALDCDGHTIAIGPTPLREAPITYVGHSPTRHVTVQDGYVYLEQGVGGPVASSRRLRAPTIIDHQRFGPWLQGVAAARSRPAPPPGLAPQPPARRSDAGLTAG